MMHVTSLQLMSTLPDDEDSDSSSGTSSGSGVVSTARRDFERQLASSAAVTASYAARSNGASSLRMSPLSSSPLSPRLTVPNVSLPSSRTLSHRLLDRPHDTSRNLVSRGNSDTTSSVVTRQAVEHVPAHATEYVTLPRVSPSQQLTGTSVSMEIAVPQPRLEPELSVDGTEPASTQDTDHTSVPSAPVSPCLSESCLSLFDSSTAPSNGETPRSSAAAQSPSPVPMVTSGAVASSSERSQFNTRANPRQVDPLSTSSTVRQLANGHTQRRSSQPATNTINRRTSQPSNGPATRQISQPSTSTNLRRTSQTPSQTSTGITSRQTPQQPGTLQPVPPRSTVPGSRAGPRKQATGAVTRQSSQHSTVRRPAPPNGTVPTSRSDNAAPVAQRRQARNKVSNSTTGNQPGAAMTNNRLPTTPGQLMRARRRSEISQEIAESLRRTHD